MRHLSIFKTLCDSMDDFVRDGRIPEQLARKVVGNFDRLVVPNFARCGVVVSFSVSYTGCVCDGVRVLRCEAMVDGVGDWRWARTGKESVYVMRKYDHETEVDDGIQQFP
jgi:hypothetical protein